jgi:asparagine N-glycosylation enzyme membrane subunit Stt3
VDVRATRRRATPVPPAGGTLGSRRAWVCAAGLAVLGFWFRVGPALPVVLPADGPARLLGTDAYDHLRRAAQWSGALAPDLAPLPAHPDDWVRPGVFDVVLALPAILATGSPPSMTALVASGVWLPPVLGALSIVLLFALARSSLPPTDAVLATILYVVYPAESLDRTTLGFGDHHAAEVALTLLAAWALVRSLRAAGERSWWRPAFLAALPMVALLHVWRGAAFTLSLLALGLATMGLAEALAGGDGRRLASRTARYGLGVATGMLLVRVARPDWQLGPDTMAREWVAVAVLLALAPLPVGLAAARRGRLGRLGPVLWAVALVAAAGAAVTAIPGLRRLAAAGPRSALVQEHVAVDLAVVLGTLGPVAVLALPGLAVALLAVYRRRLPAETLLPAVLAAGSTALWWRTRDVGYLPPPFLALLAACSLWAGRAWLVGAAARLPGAAPRRAAALALVPALVICVAPSWPYRLTDPPYTSAARVDSLLVYDDAALEAGAWLRGHTPDSSSYLVAAPWVLGSLVATVGERRPLWSRMPTASAGAWLLAPSEEESLAALAAAAGGTPVRFALVDARSCGSYFVSAARSAGVEPDLVRTGELRHGDRVLPRLELGVAYSESLAARLCFDDGSELRRYRLLWESPQRVVTAHSVSVWSAQAGDVEVRLVSLPAAQAGLLRDPGAVYWSPDGVQVLYGGRELPAFRLFAIEGDG